MSVFSSEHGFFHGMGYDPCRDHICYSSNKIEIVLFPLAEPFTNTHRHVTAYDWSTAPCGRLRLASLQHMLLNSPQIAVTSFHFVEMVGFWQRFDSLREQAHLDFVVAISGAFGVRIEVRVGVSVHCALCPTGHTALSLDRAHGAATQQLQLVTEARGDVVLLTRRGWNQKDRKGCSEKEVAKTTATDEPWM